MHTDRAPKVAGFIRDAKHLVLENGVTPESLDRVLHDLERLAGERALWSESEFPSPGHDEQQRRYLISEEGDRSFALYLNIMKPGRKTPVHNHTTWACIAAVEGCELNHVYERLDDRSSPGRADVRLRRTAEVKPGRGIAFMPDDIHAVEIAGDSNIRHLHFYGTALETLDKRVAFDVEAGTYAGMALGVQTRR
jgi:predicted metal-dependent enzyme (double-stranded beta helix superfamily)